MLQYIVRKISSNTTKLEYFYRNNKIGYVSFYNPIDSSNSISSETSLSKIFVDPNYRSNNFGSKILNLSELYLNKNYNTKRLSIVAWIPINIPNNVAVFYERNGYLKNDLFESSIYDNSDIIYDIVPLVKDLKL